MNPMVLIAPCSFSIDIVILKPMKKFLGINPMGLSDHRDYSLEIFALQTVKYFSRDDPMGLIAPKANS